MYTCGIDIVGRRWIWTDFKAKFELRVRSRIPIIASFRWGCEKFHWKLNTLASFFTRKIRTKEFKIIAQMLAIVGKLMKARKENLRSLRSPRQGK